MPTQMKKVQSPRGVARALYRLPIWLFRIRLGWLLMKHFLLLTHTGRKSGLPRQTALEVLQHDKASGRYYVFAGWGEQADWVKNHRENTAGGHQRRVAAFSSPGNTSVYRRSRINRSLICPAASSPDPLSTSPAAGLSDQWNRGRGTCPGSP
jgi:deazaflavin-dependent oxidoreductase (nitroreductase family)